VPTGKVGRERVAADWGLVSFWKRRWSSRARPFAEFKKRLASLAPSDLAALVRAGAFDFTGRGRQALLAEGDLAKHAHPPSRTPRRRGRSTAARCALAKKKNLSVVSGLCLRCDNGFREIVRRLHDGAVGKIVALQATILVLAHRCRESSGRRAKARRTIRRT
jgi:hypothetical protein